MRTLTHYELAWELSQAGMKPAEVGRRVGRDRATVYRWLAGIRRVGIREFVRRKQTAKRRRQPRKLCTKHRQLIRAIRRQHGWCGAKIRKELAVRHQVHLSLMTIYRVLRRYFRLRKHRRRNRGERVAATLPRELIEHDTVDFGEVFAYTSIDVVTKEPAVIMAADLTMQTGAAVFALQKAYYGDAYCHQSDEGSEFGAAFVEAVVATGSIHRYARPYKKNDQAHIENFNRSLRSECLGWGAYAADQLPELQARVDTYLKHWMSERWHMGLPELMTPNQFIARLKGTEG